MDSDQSAILYFSPAAPGEVQGTIYSIPALGGAPRQVIASIGAGDVGRDRPSPSSGFSATARARHLALDGSDGRVVHQFPVRIRSYRYPRWSPDLQWIAYQAGDGLRWDIYVIPAGGGEPLKLTSDNEMIDGLAWLPTAAVSSTLEPGGHGAVPAAAQLVGRWHRPESGEASPGR